MTLQTIPLDDRGSFAWIADPGEAIQRASAAIVVDGEWLVVDPVDAPGLDEALHACGPVVGVATLLDRHQRDAGAIAERLGVPRLTPRTLGGPGIVIAGIEERPVVSHSYWKEALLWLPDRKLLVCVETLGTGSFYLARQGDRLGLHPLSRLLRVQKAFAGLEPTAIAVGHGRPVVVAAGPALAAAVQHPVRDLPRGWLRAARLAYRR